ncbi:MAG: Rieske (2Fe-2S) protein [Thermoanaerobaculia bacterium]|nr:Rieske (2Fe-2S) protein [Thermoanaerobaculia bacterium]
MEEIKLAELSEIPDGGMVCRSHGGRQILLARIDDEVYAMDNVCTHAGAPLNEGDLGRVGELMVTCPWHDAHFDLRTGEVDQDTPWGFDTEVFETRVEDGEVWVRLDGE